MSPNLFDLPPKRSPNPSLAQLTQLSVGQVLHPDYPCKFLAKMDQIRCAAVD
jgi:hypothetical protein